MVLSAEMPCIEWISADGVQEHIELEGDTAAADHRNLRIEMERGELLIAEVLDPSDSLLQNPVYHLLGMDCPSEPGERCA